MSAHIPTRAASVDLDAEIAELERRLRTATLNRAQLVWRYEYLLREREAIKAAMGGREVRV